MHTDDIMTSTSASRTLHALILIMGILVAVSPAFARSGGSAGGGSSSSGSAPARSSSTSPSNSSGGSSGYEEPYRFAEDDSNENAHNNDYSMSEDTENTIYYGLIALFLGFIALVVVWEVINEKDRRRAPTTQILRHTL